MKVVYPKHIQKWMLAGMSFQIWPINLSIVQLFIVGVGVASAMGIFNSFSKSWAKAIGVLVAILVLLIFVFIAFFKMSELSLIPFIMKLIRNNFFDTKRKFQVNYEKQDPVKLAVKKSKSRDQEQTVFEQKENWINKEMIDTMNKGGLL